MESKKDIYNLWILYTTKNDECYFRQFISGFVKIWQEQIDLNLDDAKHWETIKADDGPNLSRLPEELLPAIEKFLIIARDSSDTAGGLEEQQLTETGLLLKCLTIITRNFDNIHTMVKSSYLSNCIAITTTIFKKLLDTGSVLAGELEFVKTFCNFIEVLYDPYLTWRNFLKGNYINYAKLHYRVTQLNVEIVPFIYDYFQLGKHHLFPEIGISLLNVFGAVISGAQVASILVQNINSYTLNYAPNEDGYHTRQNGLRAISPATVSILIQLLSTWECHDQLRKTALNAFTMTAIVLQKSSPEQRQIDLLTIFQMYLQAIKDLLTTQHFVSAPTTDSFEIATADDNVACIDVNALNAIIANVEHFVVKAEASRLMISNALFETKYLPALVTVPSMVRTWDIDRQLLGTTTIRTINTLCHASEKINNSLINSNNIDVLFEGLRALSPKPSYNLVNECVKFAFDLDNNGATVVGVVVIKLIEWIACLGENEQNFLSEMLLKKCAISVQSKRLVCEHRSIGKICETLSQPQRLSSKCAINLIKLIEELGKYNVNCIELKHVFGLLRTDVAFEYRRQLIECLYKISYYKSPMAGGASAPIEFFDVQTNTNGITVPEIRQWDNYQNGFVLHCWVKLDAVHESLSEAEDESRNYRRQIFSLTTSQGSGYEFFVQKNGNFVVGVNTKKDFLTTSVTNSHLLDGRWHSITVSIIPPKRLFSYHQINVYIDGNQKLGSTMKFADFKEPFHYCAIGSPYTNARKMSAPKLRHQPPVQSQESSSPKHDEKARGGGGLFPNIIERSFFPGLVSQVPHYFTLPIKTNASSLDPSVKSFPNGMQDLIFGEPICMRGQLGNVLFADTSINVKQLFEAGTNFTNLLAADLIESFDLGSKYIFCFSPAACFDGLCVDLAPGNAYNGHILANYCQALSVQDAINGIGGIMALFPILEHIAATQENFTSSSELISISPTATTADRTLTKEDQFGDWELLQLSSLTEAKINQNPIACFFCLLRNFVVGYDWNQECLLAADGIAIMASILRECNANIMDVNVLMAVQLLVEAVQNEAPASNLDLLHVLYKELVFDFRIWAKAQFQIIIGHIQYMSTIIKDDRKYFRKNFGIQFFLDTIQEHFLHNEKMSVSDLRTVREALIRIIKYYIQKEVNIKEVSLIISYLASIKNEKVVVEILGMLSGLMEAKACKDQLFLLMYEPQMAELLYALFVDKSYGNEVHVALLKLINVILNTKRISNRHKMGLRLFDGSLECGTMVPGLLSYMLPFNLETYVVLNFLDLMLASDSEAGYSGCLNLIYHSHMAGLQLKLEIAQKLLAATFTKVKSPQMLARQIGWQESIARLLIKKPITNSMSEKDELGLPDMEEIVKNESEPALDHSDLMVFDEENMEMQAGDVLRNYNNNNNMLSEAANVIEHEIKELADSVSGAVADNFSSVYSVIKQKTCDFQDTLEHLTMGSFEDGLLKKQSSSISSSEENISIADSQNTNSSMFDNASLTSRSTAPANAADTSHLNPYTDVSIDDEENLVYLISNTLFTILWRGVENTDDSWKERGQVMACINLIALNNELYCSHLTLRLRILELGVQAALIDLAENVHQPVVNQQNSAQLLRMAYDLIVLDPNEDEAKKCSTKLLDGVLSLLDMLMVFQTSSTDDWSEMTHLCLGLLLKCAHHPKSEIVAMATAKLHALLQSRNAQDLKEISYLIYSLNQALQTAIEVGNSDQYSFLIPVMKALLEKTRLSVSLTTNAPDMPSTSSGPEFFHEFQMYCTSKQWNTFIEKKIKPLYLAYQKDVSKTLREPLDTFWAECYEACKKASQHRAKLQMESRRRFQEKILVPWRVRQSEENARLSILLSTQKVRDKQVERRWLINKRFLYGPQGAWAKRTPDEEFWKLSHHENAARMRFKLEPSLYHDPHTAAANLRDNTTTTTTDQKLSAELGTTIAPAVVGDENQDEDSILIEEEMRNSIESQIPEPSGKEKIVISQECELITLMTRIKGRLDLTTNQFIFTDLNFNHRDTDEKRYDFKFPIAQIREVHLRKYNLRRSALEIFLIDHTSYFLNFATKTRNKVFSKILGLQPPNILYGSGRSPAELLRASGLTQRWVTREISNFEYLMHLNTIAGRSYNDLSQYPVFPWILADYTSEILDLTDPKSFRDLSKPIGAVNPKNEAEVRAKYEGFEDPSGMIPKFHYGTHYSNSAGVLHYLLRVEPFTSLHIELQSGRFDVADRQFHSIPQTFRLLMDNPNDVKELIPEFFYFPEFLKNTNKFDLGTLQLSKERVDDVVLPAWAKTPEDFIAIHRRALESEYVSQNLNHWIDLIFGCKQKGPKAVEALNVFYYCSYEGAVDLDKIQNPIEREAVEGMINNFGQTPSQLLKEPHPRRLSQEELTHKLLKLELKKPDMTLFLDRINSINCELSLDKDPVVFLSPPRSLPRSFLQTSPDMLFSITKSGILGCHSWMSFDKEKGFLLEIDATTTNVKNRKKLGGPFHPAVSLNSNLFAVSVDGKFLYAGGIWDNSLRVFNVMRGKAVASVVRHTDIVTCVALDNCGSYLVTGSKDCTCIIWSISSSSPAAAAASQNSGSHHHQHHGHLTHSPSLSSSSSQSQAQVNAYNSMVPKHVHTLYGHDNAVSCVAIMTELDLVVSGSLDGKVNVYTIEEGHYIRTLQPLGCSGLRIEISFVTISYQGQIAFSALDDKSHSIHVFSINGTNLGSKYVSGRVTGLATATDYIIVADDAGDLTMSRLYGLKPIFDIPLHIPTQTIVTTGGNTHILSPLRDGSLAVIGVQQPIANKKHTIVSI